MDALPYCTTAVNLIKYVGTKVESPSREKVVPGLYLETEHTAVLTTFLPCGR